MPTILNKFAALKSIASVPENSINIKIPTLMIKGFAIAGVPISVHFSLPWRSEKKKKKKSLELLVT